MNATISTAPNEPVVASKKWIGIRQKTEGRTLTIIRLEGDDRARVQHHEGSKKQTTMLFSTLRANYRPEEPAPLPLLENLVAPPIEESAVDEPVLLRLDPRDAPTDSTPGFTSTVEFGKHEFYARTIVIPSGLVPAFKALVESKQKRIADEGGSIDESGVLLGIVKKALREFTAPQGQQILIKS